MNHLVRLTVDGIKRRSQSQVVNLVTSRSYLTEFPAVYNVKRDDDFNPKVYIPEKKTDGGKRINCGPVFQGELKKRYLEYVDHLDWDNFQNHVVYFPRKHRSDEEKRLIFDKWAAHHGRKYASAELKEMRFATFKKALDNIDERNSKPQSLYSGLDDPETDIFFDKFYPFPGDDGGVVYWVRGSSRPYVSRTPKWFCELTFGPI